MAKLKIKNFGPIKNGFSENDGWFEIKKYTFFIGDQGSGKSTIAKLFSTLSWLEKAINKEDIDKGKINFKRFYDFLQYHRLENYFSETTYINYIGQKYSILFDKQNHTYPIIQTLNNKYRVPKIMYVPAERNLLSSISGAFDIKGLPRNIFTFAEELKKAQRKFKDKKVDLKISNFQYQYNESQDQSTIFGSDYAIDVLEASSGLQSYIPLYIVSKNLSESLLNEDDNNSLSVTQSIRLSEKMSEISLNKSLSDSEKIKKIRNLKLNFTNSCFYNIVEEPEQNLFPTSQWKLLCNLLEFTNDRDDNKLLITTHSPYLINYLAAFVKADQLYSKNLSNNQKTLLNTIIPLNSAIHPEHLNVYELDNNGNIKMLETYNGLPSDENLLNNSLGEINDLFVKLLEIEEQWQ